MRQTMRGVGTLGAAAALVATGACSAFGGDDEEPDDETRLVELLNESNRLEAELTEAEFRIVQRCLEEQGHTAHDQWEMQTWSPGEQESLIDWYPYDSFLPEADLAEKWGFGQWANTEEGWESGAAEEYQEEAYPESETFEEDDVDNSAFEALSPEEQYDWYVAYHGEEYAEEYYGWVLDPEWGEDRGEFEEGDVISEEVDGDLEFESEGFEEPEPGGCKLEMIESLYGGAERVEEDDAEYTYSYWSWRPERPQEEADWEEMQFEYRAAIQDEEYAFLDCLSDNGLGEWEFTEWGDLPIWAYFSELYYDDGEMMYADGEIDVETPELPDDVPDDFEGKKEFEIEMAQGFVECGETSGYRDAAQEHWETSQLDFYLDLEEDLFAWQDKMRDALSKAQDMIDA